jgi:hypothetical protein
MEADDDEQLFLSALVKNSRQRIHQVSWTDRDGTARLSALTQAELVRLKAIAQRLKVSNAEVLRRAAHIPVSR